MVLDVSPGVPGAPLRPRARLTEPGSPVCSPEWLALREPADHAARCDALAARLDAWLATRHGPAGEVAVRDLGCGTGSMGRWLAPRLAGAQRWTVHDLDGDLARRAAASAPVPTVPVAGGLAGIGDLVGTDVVVCSALLDLLRPAELEHLARRCADAGCAALLTLSVTGHVALDPADPLDGEIAAAFDAHQRRDGRLGPGGADAAAEALAGYGMVVERRESPWRLGPDDAALIEEWCSGRVDAACVQDPALAQGAEAYRARRLAALRDGSLRAVVGHADLLALPAGHERTGGAR